MTARLKTQQENSFDASFAKDVRDLFANRRAGHLGKWMYSLPLYDGDPVRGAELWTNVIEDAKNGSAYYVFNDERILIRQAAPLIASYIKNDCSLIDLGPGSKDAFLNKILPLINASNKSIKEYIGVDICPSTLDTLGSLAKETCSDVTVKTLVADFLDTPFKYPADNPSELAVLFGLTLFNLCIDPRVEELPELLLSRYLKNLGAHFKNQNGILVVTQDTNRDAALLAEAYETNRAYEETVLYRIARDLPISEGYDPEAFEMVMEFHENTGAYSMSFVATRNMDFQIDDEKFFLQSGERFYFHNSYKLQPHIFHAAAKFAGFEVIETIMSDNKRSALHIIRQSESANV